MPNQGILNDYDLLANAEVAAHKSQACAICGAEPVTYQWADRSGEAMCTSCGCPYQLKWGSKEQEAAGDYPYLMLLEEFLPIAREYWVEKRAFVCHGTMIGPKSGWKEFIEWIGQKHPEWLKSEPERKES